MSARIAETAEIGPPSVERMARRLETRRHEGSDDQTQLAWRDLYARLDRPGARAGLQFPRCPAGGVRGLHQESGARGLAVDPGALRRRRLLRRFDGSARAAEAAHRRAGETDRRDPRL